MTFKTNKYHWIISKNTDTDYFRLTCAKIFQTKDAAHAAIDDICEGLQKL